ncbi:hypothetical protein PsorP6_012553 [Peronosclerospora sorghi]|uniref:Uncharacterized protein n=1 Tax=Peronosclerospora sorghi TaxID=230839 RepID=A0ACC0WHF3_9STRA|nr:hypothetical protein PsorP6_012553 [Peronosclerospora sorghi]
MKVEGCQEDTNLDSATVSAGEKALLEMNAAFARCLSFACPPIQYPPHCRYNPVRDAADTAEIETRLEDFFLHAKQLEQLFFNDSMNRMAAMSMNGCTHDTDMEQEGADVTAAREEPSDLELEILNLEAELAEKNDLIEKYTEVVRGWEGKFKRLEHRISPDRE